MENEKELGEISFKIQKENPKPNPEIYEINTIEDLFKAANKENYKRLLLDIETIMEMSFDIKALLNEPGKEFNIQDKSYVKKFTWIDD